MDVTQKMGMEDQGDHYWPPLQSFPLGWQFLPQWREEAAGVHEEDGGTGALTEGAEDWTQCLPMMITFIRPRCDS